MTTNNTEAMAVAGSGIGRTMLALTACMADNPDTEVSGPIMVRLMAEVSDALARATEDMVRRAGVPPEAMLAVAILREIATVDPEDPGTYTFGKEGDTGGRDPGDPGRATPRYDGPATRGTPESGGWFA